MKRILGCLILFAAAATANATAVPVRVAAVSPLLDVDPPEYTIHPAKRIGSLPIDRNVRRSEMVVAFGPPTAVTENPAVPLCRLRWKHHHLSLTYANTCGSKSHCFSFASIGGGTPWRTSKGLSIGDPLEKLYRLYPNADRTIRTARNLGEPRAYPNSVSAVFSRGRVGGFYVKPVRDCPKVDP